MTAIDEQVLDNLVHRAARSRRRILHAIHQAQTGHAGPSLSVIDILTYLYHCFLRIDPFRPEWPDRDRLVFSKGHGAPALYAALAERGYFEPDLLASLRSFGGPLQGHPFRGSPPGVDQSTGSLGQGISCALGMAIGLRLQGRDSRVVCILGDGELQEGQNWEAFMAAAHFGAGNLIAVVDRNGMQSDGPTEEVMALGDLGAKLTAFGWKVMTIDGHDFRQIDHAFQSLEDAAPRFIIADTVKGRGVKFMEHSIQWHHHPISADELAAALADLEDGR